jgi:hypothetical protein
MGRTIGIVAGIVGLGFVACGAKAAQLNYEMDQDLAAAGWIQYGGGYGSTIASPSDLGPPRNAGVQGDGTAKFVDSGANNSKDGFILGGLGSSFTVDMRIKVNSAYAGSGSNQWVMGVNDGIYSAPNGSNLQRGILYDTGTIKIVNGTAGATTGTVDLTAWHMIRLEVVYTDADNATLSIYDLQNWNGSAWAPIVSRTLGGSGAPGELTTAVSGGSMSLNTMQVSPGTSITNSDFSLDWLRINVGSSLGASAPIMSGPPESCGFTVSPAGVSTVNAILGSATTYPIAYVVYNSGGLDLTAWGAVWADATGTPAPTPAWISSFTVPPPPLAGNATATVTATVNPIVVASPTSPGSPLKAYVKFTDGCASPATFTEPFTGYSSPLLTQGGWVSVRDTSPFAIVSDAGNDVLDLNGGTGDSPSLQVPDQAKHSVGMNGKDGRFTVTVKVKQGSNVPANGEVQFWTFRALDAFGNSYGLWKGTQFNAYATNPVSLAISTNALPAPASGYKTMEMRIDTNAQTVDYYYDGVNVNPPGSNSYVAALLANTARGGIDQIAFEEVNGSVSAGDSVYFDDPTVTATELYKLREIDLNVIGCAWDIQPNSRTISAVVDNGVPATSSDTFTVTNNGSDAITGLTVVTIDPTSGLPVATPAWLNLTVPTDPIAPGGTATVTATVTWSAASTGSQNVGLRFTGSSTNCSGGLTLDLRSPPGVTAVKLLVNTYKYEMDSAAEDLLLTQPDGSPPWSNVDPPNSGYGPGGAGGGIGLSNPGSVDWCTKFARFVDNNSIAGGNYAFYLRGLCPAGSPGFTVDMRIAANAPCLGTGSQQSMGVCNSLDAGGGNAGRNIRVEPTVASPASNDNSLQLTIVGAGVVGGPFTIDSNTATHTRFHMIRLVVSNATNDVQIYDLEKKDTDGVSWLKVGAPTALGLSVNMQGGLAGGGVQLNTSSGGITTQSDWSADWVRIMDNVLLGPTDDIIGGAPPECSLWADVDHDGDVDQEDFAVLQLCYTGSGFEGDLGSCGIFDHSSSGSGTDGSIDSFDVQAFNDCATGPGIPYDLNNLPTDCTK